MCLWLLLDRLWTQTLKKIFLRSEVEINGQNSDDQTEDVSDDLILADTYCESSSESVSFIKVKNSFESAAEIIKNFKDVTACGLRYIEWWFIEKVDVLAKGFLYKLSKKKNSFLRNL